MKTLKITYDTFAGTGNAVCKYGVLLRDTVIALCGDGVSVNDCWPGAGVRSVITTWEAADPQTISMIKKSCRDYRLRAAAFNQQNRINNIKLNKWKMSSETRGWARKQVSAGLA